MRLRFFSVLLVLAMLLTPLQASCADAEGLRQDALTALQALGLFTQASYQMDELPALTEHTPKGRVRYAVYSPDQQSALLQICDAQGECISMALQIDGGMEGELADSAVCALLCAIEPDVFDADKAEEALQSMRNIHAYHERLASQLDAVNGTKTEHAVYASYFTDAMMYELTDSFFYANNRACLAETP